MRFPTTPDEQVLIIPILEMRQLRLRMYQEPSLASWLLTARGRAKMLVYPQSQRSHRAPRVSSPCVFTSLDVQTPTVQELTEISRSSEGLNGNNLSIKCLFPVGRAIRMAGRLICHP